MMIHFQFYIIPIFACICFLACIIIGRITPMKMVSKYFFVATVMILVIILLEVAETFFKLPNYTYPSWQRWVTSIIAYILRPVIAYILLLILLRDKEKGKWFYPVMTLPLVVNAIFLLISPFCGIVYYFDRDNYFVNGPMRPLPFVVGFLYGVVYLVLFIAETRSKGSYEWVISIPVAFSCSVSVYLESEYNLLGSLPMACLLCMIFYYIFIYIEYSTKDVLTGALLRNRFYDDIKCDGFRYFIIYDVNGLKHINDELGHLYGDNALSKFGHCVLSSLPKGARLYRIGGDEFAIVYSKAKKEDIDALVKEIGEKLDLEDIPFGVSCGYSSFDKGCDFNNAYKRADEMLYKCKNSYWANHTPDILKEKDNKSDNPGTSLNP